MSSSLLYHTHIVFEVIRGCYLAEKVPKFMEKHNIGTYLYRNTAYHWLYAHELHLDMYVYLCILYVYMLH